MNTGLIRPLVALSLAGLLAGYTTITTSITLTNNPKLLYYSR